MKKVTEDELKEIQTLRLGLSSLLTTIGELQLNKFLLNKELTVVDEKLTGMYKQFDEFQVTERVLLEKLNEKYGTGSIDIETGEILG